MNGVPGSSRPALVSAPGLRRVIKVGTSLLRGHDGRSTQAVITDLATSLARCRGRGEAIALVTSGAVGLGCHALALERRPAEVVALQAAAAVGQGRLMALYQEAFAIRGLTVAQVLLTRGDLASRRRYQNACLTLEQLLAWGVVPIVNENDTLATDELRFGDNDTLSALVAVAIGAEELVLLTDIDRLYSGDPRHDPGAHPIDEVRDLAELEQVGRGAGGGGRWGTGGMGTKITAARIATTSGVRVRLIDGRDPAPLEALLAGERVGTLFHPSRTPLGERKGWLAHAVVPQGSLRVDGGAAQALLHRGASLLAVGILAVEGRFARDQPVRVLDGDGREIGRGLVALGSEELLAILGRDRGERTRPSGGAGELVIHRDHFVLSPAAPVNPATPPA